MSNNIRILNLDPQEITINGTGTPTGITNVYVNGVDVTVGTKAYVIVPTKLSQLTNDEGFITNADETDPTVPYYVKEISMADINAWNDKQDGLVSGVNIKTINNKSLLGSGDIQITATEYVAGTGIDITGNVISNTITSYDDLTDLPTQVTRTSQLINDSGFITNQVDDLENYIPISDLENILPSTSDSGTGDLYLEDSAKYKMKITLDPQEFQQETTTGAQLFDLTDGTYSNNGVDAVVTNGVVTLSGTASANAFIDIPVSTELTWTDTETYTVSAFNSSTANVNIRINTSGTFDTQLNATDKTNTFTYGNEANMTTNKIILKVQSGTSLIDFSITPMLEIGSGNATYEKFTGGMASPNPLYPQDLHVISGENSITLSNKNIADINNIQVGKSWANSSNTQRATILYIPIKRSQEYSLVSSWTNEHITQVRGVLNNGPDDTSNNAVVSGTFTTPADKWSYISIEVLANTTFTTSMLTGLRIMLCYGSADLTEYVDHQETVYPIDLGTGEYCRYGDYKDRYFKNIPSDPRYHDNWPYGRWYMEANVEKVYLMDNNNFDDIQTGLGYYQFENTDPVNIPRPPLLDYEGISYYFNPNNTDHNHIQIISNHIIIQMNDKIGITSLEDLNDWLYNNQVTAYFKCEEGTAQIYGTSDTLNNQLEAIHNAIAYDGGTIISQTNDDLAFDITASAFKKVS